MRTSGHRRWFWWLGGVGVASAFAVGAVVLAQPPSSQNPSAIGAPASYDQPTASGVTPSTVSAPTRQPVDMPDVPAASRVHVVRVTVYDNRIETEPDIVRCHTQDIIRLDLIDELNLWWREQLSEGVLAYDKAGNIRCAKAGTSYVWLRAAGPENRLPVEVTG